MTLGGGMGQDFFDKDELDKLYSDGNPQSANENTKQNKVTFKDYSTMQTYIFPPSTDDYISKVHIARFVSAVIDRIGIGFLIDKYKGGGASAYHLSMMLKVLILGCIYRIYSSRKPALALA